MTTIREVEAFVRLHLGDAIDALEGAGIGCAIIAAPLEERLPIGEGIAVVCGSVPPEQMQRAFRRAAAMIAAGNVSDVKVHKP
jgi:hypothetical protein